MRHSVVQDSKCDEKKATQFKNMTLFLIPCAKTVYIDLFDYILFLSGSNASPEDVSMSLLSVKDQLLTQSGNQHQEENYLLPTTCIHLQ